MPTPYVPSEVRFWAKVDKSGDCWIWTGARKEKGGYGSFGVSSRRHLAHRFAYELLVGPIPSGLTLDHLCRNKVCVNPAHLEPVTRGENVRRHTRLITTCPQGHEYDSANTYFDRRGRRSCRACNRAAWHRNKGNLASPNASETNRLAAGGEV